MLGALGYWGFRAGNGLALKLGLGLGAPLLAAVVWGALGAPGAPVRLSAPLHLLLELIVFGAGVAALYAAGRQGLAGAFAVLFLLNRVLMFVWTQ